MVRVSYSAVSVFSFLPLPHYHHLTSFARPPPSPLSSFGLPPRTPRLDDVIYEQPLSTVLYSSVQYSSSQHSTALFSPGLHESQCRDQGWSS